VLEIQKDYFQVEVLLDVEVERREFLELRDFPQLVQGRFQLVQLFFGAAGFLGFVSLAGIAALRRLATGSSMVEEAERTNSPISCNLARTSLLS